MFQPAALKSLGSINKSATQFTEDLSCRISVICNDACEGSFLFQPLLVLLQHFNASTNFTLS